MESRSSTQGERFFRASTCVQRAVEETYKTQAINFAASFSKSEFETDIKVFEIIDSAISSLSIQDDISDLVRDTSATLFRNICYSSNNAEIEYLNTLLKFFTIKFVMDGDSAVTNYFSDMVGKLRVYIGTDIIVRCLSETLVQEASRGMTNSLALLTSAGVRLRLTRQTVGEVFAHIRHSSRVFQAEFEAWFRHAELDDVKNSDRILIRSFFYAYLEPERHVRAPSDWSDYLGNFGASYWFGRNGEEETDEYVDEFASYLVDKFNLEFVEIDEIIEEIDNELAEKIADKILGQRSGQTEGSRILAMNDAQMALFVNRERAKNRERVSSNLYGFNTWWLTEERTVLRALRDYGQRADVVMHPQFLMNHYILDPSFLKQGSRGDRAIMPTLFGLRITDRIASGDMREFTRAIGNLADLDEAAQKARIRRASNVLKRKQPSKPRHDVESIPDTTGA